jgi:hypothetical protein
MVKKKGLEMAIDGHANANANANDPLASALFVHP